MATGEWFYAQNGQQAGPVALDALCMMLAKKAVQETDLVWTSGMSDWKPANIVPQLASAAAGFHAPAPPVAEVPLPKPPVVASTAAEPSATGAPAGYSTLTPVAPLDYQTRPVVPVYAGFWLRFCAYLIDTMFVAIVAFVVVSGSDFLTHTSPARGSFNLMSVLIGWLYFAIMESSDMQATFGKLVLGLRVTDLSGQKISFGQATGRHFAKILSALILCVGYMMAGFTEQKQALHDMLAGCLVLHRSSWEF